VRAKLDLETPGKSGPAIFAFYAQSLSSKASPPGYMLFRTQRKTLEPKPEGLPIRNGASPVASALSNRPRRDPGAAVRTYHGVPSRPLETGTFYLAGNRNFLFGSDTKKKQEHVTDLVCDIICPQFNYSGNAHKNDTDE
jgi:hypothetical protein